MIRDFFKHNFIYTFGILITRGLSIILIPIYTKFLLPKDYGVLELFNILLVFVYCIFTIQISQSIARFYQDSRIEKNNIVFVSTAFWFIIFMYVVYFIISFVAYNALYDFFDISKTHFCLGTFYIITTGIFYFVQDKLRYEILPQKNLIVNIVNALIIAVLSIVLLSKFNLNIKAIFMAQIIGNLCAILLSIYYGIQDYKFVFDFKILTKMLKFSFPLVFSGLTFTIATYIDRIMVNSVFDNNALGIYSIAYKFASVTGLLISGLQSTLTPLVYKFYRNSNTPHEISIIFDIFCCFALFIILVSILFSGEILIIFTNENYYGAKTSIPILIIASFFSNMYVFTPGIGIAKKTNYSLYISIIFCISNICLNFTLLEKLGVIGASISTLISSIILFSLFLIISNKYYKINLNIRKNLFTFIGVLFFGYLFECIFKEINILNAVIKLLPILCFILYYGIINRDRIKNVWHKYKWRGCQKTL